MFFVLSKTIGYLAMPSNLLIAIGLVGLVLLLTRFRRLASWLIVTSLVLIALVGYYWLTGRTSELFPAP